MAKSDEHTATDARSRIPSSTSTIMLPQVVGGRYLLQEKLGTGGMAQVYRATDPQLDRSVAIKLLNPKLRADPEFDSRFRREAKILSKLNDPHIVVVHDFGIDPTHGPFLVMELLVGESLRQRLNVQGPLPASAALQLGEQLMLALAHAHSHGIVHRDLKPDNVFLLAQSGVKLHVTVLDFGVARMVLGDAPADGFQTMVGATIGTPRYMSPEQLAGLKADERSDLFSAAVVLYETLTGQIPELIGSRLNELCPTAPPGLDRVLDECLRGNPDQRPISAMEVYLRLHELVKQAGGDLLVSDTAISQMTARFQPKPSPATVKPSRRRWIWAAAGLATVAALSATLKFWPRAHPRPDSESLLGLRIGDSRDDVVSRLGKPSRTMRASQFASEVGAQPLLRIGDIVLESDALTWNDNSAVVYLRGGGIAAIMARSPHVGATGRDLRIGDSEARLRAAYPERPTAVDVFDNPDGGWGQIVRYGSLGVAVELRQGKVCGLAVFRPGEAALPK